MTKIFSYIATSGPDIQYSKTHLSDEGADRALCGLKSSSFSQSSNYVLNSSLEFSETPISSTQICQRCQKIVSTRTDIPEVVKEAFPESIPELKAEFKIVSETEYENFRVQRLTIQEYTSKNMIPQDAVLFYFPELVRRQIQFLLLKYTSYPLAPELMLRQIQDLKDKNPNIF